MDSGQVLYGCHADVHVLRYIGDVRYPLAPSIKSFFDHLFDDGTGKGVVIDLAETSVIDSTNLGLLARLALRLSELGAPRATVLAPREDIYAVLASMGFDDVFDVRRSANGEAADSDSERISAVGGGDLPRVMLEAHRVLMELNDANADQFSEVVSMLENEVS